MMEQRRPDLKKTNRKIICTILSACAGVAILAGIAANVAIDDYMRHLMKKVYAELDQRCPQPLDSVTVMESVRFFPENWTVDRSLRCLDMDLKATDSVSRYKLDTLVRDRKNRIKERMRVSPTPSSPAIDDDSSVGRLAGYFYRRTERKLFFHTMYYDKHGDFIMEITFTPEDYKEIRRKRRSHPAG